MNRHISLLCVLLASPALAQSDIPDAHKFSWQENVGWMNWRDANATSQGDRKSVV